MENYYARGLLDIKDRELNSKRFWAGDKFEKLFSDIGTITPLSVTNEYLSSSKESKDWFEILTHHCLKPSIIQFF